MTSSASETRIAMRNVWYNRHSSLQNAAMQAALEYIPSFPNSKDITIVDYGCSQGANSIEALTKAISTLPDGAVARLFFEDTSFNDFSTLATTIHGKLPTSTSATKSYSIFPAMVPVGFFNQVIPNASADLGFSWSAFNYLETEPTVPLDLDVPNPEYMAARHKAFSTAAAKDLIKLLALRGRETRPGGYFVTAIGASTSPDGLMPSDPGFAPIQTALVKMVGVGELSQAEMMKFSLFPSHERTLEEIKAALTSQEVAALWTVESLETKLIEHPAWEPYQSRLESTAAEDEMERKAALRDYAYAVVMNLVSSAGWYWVDILQSARGQDWHGGEAFLDRLTALAVDECLQKFPQLRSRIWYHYLKLKRASS